MSFLNENEPDTQSDDSEDEEYMPSDQSEASSEEELNCFGENEKVENEKVKRTGKAERDGKGKKQNGATKGYNINDYDPVEERFTEEEEKKRSEALWADFLSDNKVESKKHSKATSTVCRSHDLWSSESSDTSNSKTMTEIIRSPQKALTQTLHGLEKQTKKIDNIKPSVSKPAAKLSGIPFKRPAGGIHSILGQINKKNKLTVLERSKQDWDSFKTSHGLNEELWSFNRGKEGYLERQDFLERTDLRQFEIEKGMRQGRRSK